MPATDASSAGTAPVTFIHSQRAGRGADLLRREVEVEDGHGPVVHASLTLSAFGIIEAWVNGDRICDHVLEPGWTSYEWRVHSVEHDVTGSIADRVAIGLRVGRGWFAGRLGWVEDLRYGERPSAYARLTIEFADGHLQSVVTDDSWSAGQGEVLDDDLYDGQTVDARLRDDNWQLPGFDDDRWGPVNEIEVERTMLAPDTAPPVRRIAELPPVDSWRTPSGRLVLDFGQNIVGWLRVRLRGERGTSVIARHAEVLEGREIATRPLRSVKATDRFILSGNVDEFEPTLTFHGFRYAELEGWPADCDPLEPGAISAIAISSDLRRTGHFACSDPLLTQFHDNVVWGMRGNFIDIPTDCPQRDERLGWTGDIAAFAPTAAFLFDVKAFLADWLEDLALEQQNANGLVPYTVPDILKYGGPDGPGKADEPAAIWGDAAVWVPWALWEAYGDRSIIERAFPSMVAHGRRVAGLLSEDGVWDTGFQFGDWLDPDAPAAHPERAKADPSVVATACAYRSARVIADAARLIGADVEADFFDRMAADVRSGFSTEYIASERITSDCATVYVLAIEFDLLDEHDRGWAGRRLAELVEESGYRISTGFAGTPFILDALSSTGHLGHAYRLLLQTECPSWLYPVTMGATTVWERWDSMLPDGSINPGEMTSFNHYALGAVADWLHRVVGGIAPMEPGYARVRIAPRPGGGITSASTSLSTSHGTIAVRWESTESGVVVDVTLPAGVTGELVAPDGRVTDVAAGRAAFTW